MADGYIQFRKEKHIPNIVLSLSAVDDAHLVKYASYLKTDKPVYYYEVDGLRYARLEISSKEIGDRLIAFGVIPRKSWVAEAKCNLENSVHFWRGVVDGDGCINITGAYPRLRVVGSKPLMNQLLFFFKKHVITNTNVNPVWYTDPETAERYITAYDVNIVGSQAVPIIKLLYERATIFLTRKNVLAQGIIKDANDDAISNISEMVCNGNILLPKQVVPIALAGEVDETIAGHPETKTECWK